MKLQSKQEQQSEMVSTSKPDSHEDMRLNSEITDNQESHCFIVHIPDGFTKEDIGAKVENDFRSVSVYGERLIVSKKKVRFNEKHHVPSHCDVGNIIGKFDGKTVTIIMPKKPVSEVPQQNTSHQDPKKTYIEKGKDMINDKLGDDKDGEKKTDKKSFHKLDDDKDGEKKTDKNSFHKLGDDKDGEKKTDKKSFHESTDTTFKDIALSTTQAVTNYAKRFNEEDKQKLIYTGAAILVVALGVYASYKYRSSWRRT